MGINGGDKNQEKSWEFIKTLLYGYDSVAIVYRYPHSEISLKELELCY